MKRLAIMAIPLLLFLNIQALGLDLYFTAQAKNDSDLGGDGLSPETPRIGVEALNETLSTALPGDRFFLKKGDRFVGAVLCSAKGTKDLPIVISTYGTGSRPIVTDLVKTGAWARVGINLWSSAIVFPLLKGKFDLFTLVKSGRQLSLGRYPNADAPWGGCLAIGSHSGKNSITPPGLPRNVDWKGAEVILRSMNWIWDRLRVKSCVEGTLSFAQEASYEPSEASYEPDDRYGFFIQNHPATLDLEGEWCYDREKGSLLLYTASDPNKGDYKFASQLELINLKGSEYVLIEGIEFSGGNMYTAAINGSTGLTIRDCAFNLAGRNAVSSERSFVHDFLFSENAITTAQNNAIQVYEGKNVRILNNHIMETALVAGMGAHGDNQYIAIMVSADGLLIEGNRIERTGYIPIYFQGDDVIVRRNLIDDFGLCKDDVGGIYTSGYGGDYWKNRVISENFIRNGKASLSGKPWTDKLSVGIYIDDRSPNVVIERNIACNNPTAGIYIHNAHEIAIRDNLCFASDTALLFIHDNISIDHPIRGVDVSGNALFSADIGATMVRILNRLDSVEPGIVFTGNFYTCPFTKDAQFSISLEGKKPVYYNLEQWVAKSGRDPFGTINRRFIDPFVVDWAGPTLVDNGKFTEGLSEWATWSGSGKGRAVVVKSADPGSAKLQVARLFFTGLSGSENPSPYTQNLSLLSRKLFKTDPAKQYRLRFKARSSIDGLTLAFMLRSDVQPGERASEESAFILGKTMKGYELIFSPYRKEDKARAEFNLYEKDMPTIGNLENAFIELTDVELNEVTTNKIDTRDYYRFEPNFTDQEKTIGLQGLWIDMRQIPITGDVKIAPYSAGVFLKQ